MSEPDYIDRTIATVRNHRDADNCWPQWANIFADEIERLREQLEAVEARVAALTQGNEQHTAFVKEIQGCLADLGSVPVPDTLPGLARAIRGLMWSYTDRSSRET
jgi:hypothetical protein